MESTTTAARRPKSRRRTVRQLTATVGAAALLSTGSVLLTAPAAQAAPPLISIGWVYVGDVARQFVVPSGVTSIAYEVTGAAGGKGGGTNGGAGGGAHTVTGTMDVTAGDVLVIYVGEPGGVGLNEGDTENSTPTVGLPGEGGWGWTIGGDGGFGSLLSRPGGGGGGSSAIVPLGTTTPEVVAAGGGGGGGRGVFGFCFGGDGGAGDSNGAPGLAADDCLIPGLGGLTDQGLNGNGTDGGDVILFGGGGGGGGAGAAGQGGGGGFAGAHPGVPVNLGAGGGGGAGGGSVLGDPDGTIINTDPTNPDDFAFVGISYARSFDTSLSALTVGTPVYGEPAEVVVDVANTTDGTIVVDGGAVTLSEGGAEIATEEVENGSATFELADLPPGTTSFDLAYVPEPISVFEASTGSGSLEVAPAPTGTTIDIESTPYFGSTDVTATVTPDTSGLGVPTGAVEFLLDGNPVYAAELIDGTATLTSGEILPGDYEISARYSGDDFFAESTSAGEPFFVGKGLVDISVDTGANPNPANVDVTPVVTLEGSSDEVGPSGDVELRVDGEVVQTITLDPSDDPTRTVRFDPLSLEAGGHDIDASYLGDELFDESISAPVIQETTAVTPTPTPTPVLPHTGADVTGVVWAGGLLAASGLGLLVLGLRRRSLRSR